MIGAILSNKSPVGLDQVTPIARLTGDPLVIVVPANSPIKTVQELAAAVKGRSGQGDLGRRLGRRRGPHPRGPVHQGGRLRSGEGQLHRLLGRRRGPGGHARRPGDGRCFGLWRVREPDQGRQAAGAGDLLRQAPGRRRRSDPEGAGHGRRGRELARHHGRRRRLRRTSARRMPTPSRSWSSRRNGPRSSSSAAGTISTSRETPFEAFLKEEQARVGDILKSIGLVKS